MDDRSFRLGDHGRYTPSIGFKMGRLATYIAIEGDRLDSLWSLGDDAFRDAF